MEMWPAPAGGPPRPWVDWTTALPAAGFCSVAMDQRNAGHSITAIEADHGWHTYAADHLALMDHLGFDKFHVLGGCIGGSFCLKAIETAPDRVTAAVLQNPIGRHPQHPAYFPKSHVEWGAEQRAGRPEITEAALAGFGRNMWDHDFVFSVDREFAKNCPAPTFLLPGTDIPHPAATSAELAELLPGVEVLTDWRGPDFLAAQESRVVAFLKRHTPAMAR
jgi:pimeloyl-ACP methyl ester carboxylesterase